MSYVKNILLIHGLMFIILTIPVSFSHFDFAFSQRNGPHFGNEGQGGYWRPTGPRWCWRPTGPRWCWRPTGPRWCWRPTGPRWCWRPTGPRWCWRPTGPRWCWRPTGPSVLEVGGAGCSTGPNGIGGAGCPTGSKNTVSSTDNTITRGQGGAGCSTGPNGIGGAGCPTGSKDTVSSTDNTITRGQGGAGCPTGPNGIGGAGCPTGSKDTVSSTDNTNNVIVDDSSSTDSSSTDSSLVGKTYIIHGPTDKTGGNPYSSTASCHSNDLILGGGSIYDITDGNVTSFSAIPDSLSTFTTKITSSSNSDSALTVQAYAICYDNP